VDNTPNRKSPTIIFSPNKVGHPAGLYSNHAEFEKIMRDERFSCGIKNNRAGIP
jgi:hypothetical protein